MKPIVLAGVVLIVVGVAALLYQSVSYTSRETVIDIGPLQATADRERTLAIPPALGMAVVLGGAALLIVGLRKSA
jgi:hypothetical protein